MNAASLAAYAAALLLAVATPGPAMFTVVSTGVSRGIRPATAIALGIAVGDVVLGGMALIGLIALVATFGWVFAVIKYAGAAYLIWLGVKLWRSTSHLANDRPSVEGSLRGFGLGLAVAVGNPKAILFHASLMPLLLDLTRLTMPAAITVLGIIFAINLAVMTGYAALSSGASRWFRTPARLRWLNRVSGGAFVGTGVAIASLGSR